VAEAFDGRAGVDDVRLALGLAALQEGLAFLAPLVHEAAQFAHALFKRRTFLAGEPGDGLFLAGELDLGFGEGGVGVIPLEAEVFDLGGQAVTRSWALASAPSVSAGGRRGLRASGRIAILGGKAVDLVDDGVDALVEDATRVLEGVELALVGGDGDFLGAQFGLGLLEAGLEFGLLRLQGALVSAGFTDLFLELGELALEFGDLVLTGENRGRPCWHRGRRRRCRHPSRVRNLSGLGDEVEGAAGGDPPLGGSMQTSDTIEGGSQEPIDQGRRTSGLVGLDRVGAIANGSRQGLGRRRVLPGTGLGTDPGTRESEGGDAGAAFPAGGEVGENVVGGVGLLGQDELEVVAERGFDGGDVAP
jgi:hypothetical protein